MISHNFFSEKKGKLDKEYEKCYTEINQTNRFTVRAVKRKGT